MRSSFSLFALLLAHGAALAQYPFTRAFEPRAGQQRPHCHHVVQDGQGLLWIASDAGVLRTDGERTDAVWSAEGVTITALCATATGAAACTARGDVLLFTGYRCDTLLRDTSLRSTPVRSMFYDAAGTLWLGTYGGGVKLLVTGAKTLRDLGGLPDPHVNALCMTGEGVVAVATDQGIALCDPDKGVLTSLGEEQGLPDNLVLSLALDDQGRLWAGMDRAGVCAIHPLLRDPRFEPVDSAWVHGPVVALACGYGLVWAGTARYGTIVCDRRGTRATYVPPVEVAGRSVVALMRAADGTVWQCDGSDRLLRSDADVLLVPEHEGLDLRHITALCSDARGRIWFANSEGVFRHASAFAHEARITRLPLSTSPDRPVVCLRVDTTGALWAGTMGNGLFRLDTNGSVQRFTVSDGLANDNVLAARMRGMEMWFATLGGLSVCQDVSKPPFALNHPAMAGTGFVYDVLPLRDGRVLAATDGSGIVELGPSGTSRRLEEGSTTYYSLGLDRAGTPWATGPSTGLCRADGPVPVCAWAGKPPFDGNVFGMRRYGQGLLVAGHDGVVYCDIASGALIDLGRVYGLRGLDMELNTMTVDPTGAVWLACDQGLVRMAPRPNALDPQVTCAITAMFFGDRGIDIEGPPSLAHDQNYISFRFAGPYYAATEAVRFEYRLTGYDDVLRTTRDREVHWASLPPGDYRFEVRAFIAGSPPPERWCSVAFTIAQPWWRTPWALVLWIMLIALTVVAVIHVRDGRLRLQDRMEKEKVHFQMQVLRSQVNPHFLFNSFNTLIELIEQSPDRAVKHVEQLSDFFREILQVRDKELIPLRDELRLVDTYFFLEQRRFGDRIALRTSVTEAAMDLLVPPLTVQLLVENALKHNRASDAEPLVITLAAAQDEFTVSHAFRPREAMPKSTGFGIDSIRKRFSALTDRPVSFGQDGDLFVARVPLIPPTHAHLDR